MYNLHTGLIITIKFQLCITKQKTQKNKKNNHTISKAFLVFF